MPVKESPREKVWWDYSCWRNFIFKYMHNPLPPQAYLVISLQVAEANANSVASGSGEVAAV